LVVQALFAWVQYLITPAGLKVVALRAAAEGKRARIGVADAERVMGVETGVA
jgi:hypothetical protein